MLRTQEAVDYLLWLSCNADDSISNLKLQKLLYYAQGYCLAKLDKPLFDAPIESWQHGPVVKEVYHTYKTYGNGSIPCPKFFRLKKYRVQEREIMDEVYSIYGQFSAWTLRDMTHEEPLWRETRDGEVIGTARLREYFMTKVKTRPVIVQAEAKGWDEIASEVLERRHKLWEKLAKV
ncbi:MAG: SocA family protein [Anaerolineales bacterium]|nr:SocA family protein [Anaerolineales bacterium]MCA9928622.1 SocA family protein [Anaerolineales bacterium]